MQLHSWHQRQLQSLCCARPHPFPRMVRNEGHWRHCPQLADSLLVATIQRFSGLPLSLGEKGWRWLCTRYAIRSVPFENACTELYIPKAKSIHWKLWCDMVWHHYSTDLSRMQDGSIMRMLTVENHRHAIELLIGAEDWRCHRDSIRALGRRRVLWSIHPMQWDASGRFESVGYWLIIVDGHVDPLWGWAWGWRRWQRKMKVILLIIYAKEFIFAWLKVKISWWSTLPIYLQLITYYTWWYNVQDPTYPLSNTAKHPNTQQPNKPKKHEETRHRSVKKNRRLRHVRPSCCLHPKRRLFRCSDLWVSPGPRCKLGGSWVSCRCFFVWATGTVYVCI